MPKNIKIVVSLITLIVGIIFYYYESRYGELLVARVGIGLSVFMIVAMWMFREGGTQHKSGK